MRRGRRFPDNFCFAKVMMMRNWRQTVRAVVRSQPFNWTVTSALNPFNRMGILPPEWLIMHLPHVGTVTAKMPNGAVLKLGSPGDDPIANRVCWLGWDASEPEAIRVFFSLARTANTILDVGAYCGYFSLVAAFANPHAHVYAFEPVPELCQRFQHNIELNRLSDRITCIPSAVGASDGCVKFFRGGDAAPSCSSLSQTYALANCRAVKEIDVTIVQLDTWAQTQGVEHVDLLKIDVESMEPDVLTGMKSLLEKSSPDIICEVLHSEGTASILEAMLKPYAYRFFLLTTKGPQPVSHIHANPQWRNYLFSKKAIVDELPDHGRLPY